jgi:hypothetical protein
VVPGFLGQIETSQVVERVIELIHQGTPVDGGTRPESFQSGSASLVLLKGRRASMLLLNIARMANCDVLQ